MDEAHVVTGGAAADPAGGEMDAARREPFDRSREVVHPEAHVIERRLGDARSSIGIERLHEVDFDRERARAGAEDVLVDIFARHAMTADAFETEEVDPELRETRLVRAPERNLLHSENTERSRLAQ